MALRILLRVAECPYTMAVRWRNRSYDCGAKEAHAAGVPVVSVGNLTMGGTGKTPMVAWLCRWFRNQGRRVAIVSRGYGAAEDGRNDEAMELEQQLPDVPHAQDPDRVAAARVVTEELETELIVLDDGFQHRRLRRDLDIVLLDALEPFGHDHVFPRGTLREPVSGLSRADVVVLSRSDMMEETQREQVRQRAKELAPQAAWAEVVHAPRALISASGEEQPLESLRGKRVAAFSGIGNPAGFRHTLETCGYDVTRWREYPDHHRYSREDIEALVQWAMRAGDLAENTKPDESEAETNSGEQPAAEEPVEAVLCTHKDLVKIDLPRLGNIPLLAVAVGIEFRTGEVAVVERLERLLANENAETEGPKGKQ